MGPILILLFVIILGYLQQDYDHIRDFISELGAIGAPYAIYMNYLGFTFLGISIIFFGLTTYYKLNFNFNDKLTTIGIILIFVSGLSFFLIAFFPCDANCINKSIIGIIHSNLSDIAQFSMIISILFIYINIKNKSSWKYFDDFSLISFFMGIIFALIYNLNIIENYDGLLQRISFGIPLIWIFIMSIKILISKNNDLN
jgi:hypothetical membrane protein